MSTPKAHGGAALAVIPLTSPAFMGLNKEGEQSILGPEWATTLTNTVLDDQNRVAARNGWNGTTTQVQYIDSATTATTVSQVDGVLVNVLKIAHGLSTGDYAEITGASPTTYNGNYYISKIDNDNFQYRVLVAPASAPATGTILFQQIDTLQRGIEFRRLNGGSSFVVAAQENFYESGDNGATWAAKKGSLPFSGTPDVQFTHFNDNLYAAWNGHAPVQKVTTGNFTVITPLSTAVPISNGTILGAFGRLWVVDVDNAAIHYSGLLDPTDWDGATAGSGSVDTTSIWPDNDKIVALATHNGQLVIFGENNIILMDDSTGSVLGLDPLNIFVTDMITGVGCRAKHSISAVGGDTWFLAQQGVTSLGRLIQEKSVPLTNVSQNVQKYLDSFVTGSTTAEITSVYHSNSRFYLLSLPSVNGTGVEDGRVFAFDTRSPLPDGSFRCMGDWTGLVPKVIFRTRVTENLHMSYRNSPGELGLYNSFKDAEDGYLLEYWGGWNDFGNPATFKIMKKARGVFNLATTADVTFKIAFDFTDGNIVRRVATVGSAATPSLYGGTSFWGGSATYSGGVDLDDVTTNLSGMGEYVKVGISTLIDGGSLAIQSLSYAAKLGRNTI